MIHCQVLYSYFTLNNPLKFQATDYRSSVSKMRRWLPLLAQSGNADICRCLHIYTKLADIKYCHNRNYFTVDEVALVSIHLYDKTPNPDLTKKNVLQINVRFAVNSLTHNDCDPNKNQNSVNCVALGNSPRCLVDESTRVTKNTTHVVWPTAGG